MIVDFVVEANRKLILVVGSDRNRLILIGSHVRGGDELVQQIGGDRILACGRNRRQREKQRPSR